MLETRRDAWPRTKKSSRLCPRNHTARAVASRAVENHMEGKFICSTDCETLSIKCITNRRGGQIPRRLLCRWDIEEHQRMREDPLIGSTRARGPSLRGSIHEGGLKFIRIHNQPITCWSPSGYQHRVSWFQPHYCQNRSTAENVSIFFKGILMLL